MEKKEFKKTTELFNSSVCVVFFSLSNEQKKKMVRRYYDENLEASGQELELYDCVLKGDNNIITGSHNSIMGDGNVVIGHDNDVDGEDNSVMETKIEEKRGRKRERRSESGNHPIGGENIRKKIDKHLKENVPDDFGPGGLKLIRKTKDEPVKEGMIELLYCLFCREYARKVSCDPCGHFCMCVGCSRKIGAKERFPQCPICKTKITGFRETFLC